MATKAKKQMQIELLEQYLVEHGRISVEEINRIIVPTPRPSKTNQKSETQSQKPKKSSPPRSNANIYLSTLQDLGYQFEKVREGHRMVYVARGDYKEHVLYRPLTEDLFQRFLCCQILHQHKGGTLSYLMDSDIFKDIIDKKSHTLMDFLAKMHETDDLEKRYKNGIPHYYPTGKNIPLYYTFRNPDDIYNLYDALEKLSPDYPYYQQLLSIKDELRILSGMDTEEDSMTASHTFITHGRSYHGASSAESLFSKFAEIPFQNYVVQITYVTATGNEITNAYGIALQVYSMEKDRCYYLCKPYTVFKSTKKKIEDKNYFDGDTIALRIDHIKQMEVLLIDGTAIPNTQFCNPEIIREYSEMFDIVIEPPCDIVVRVKDIHQNRNKFERMYHHRKSDHPSCSMQTCSFKDLSPSEQESIITSEVPSYFEYKDRIRGTEDFAHYLRSLGSNAEVMQPQNLRKRMKESAERTLAKYKEYQENA